MPNYDSEYVSQQPHEVKHISKRFVDKAGEPLPMGWIFFTLHLAMGKMKRKTFYSMIKSMGYVLAK